MRYFSNKRNNKGVTLTVLAITIVILLIIASIVVINATTGIEQRALNNMYNDIRALDGKIALYYDQHAELPISYNESGEKQIINKEDVKDTNKNPNDNDIYYVIDKSKLDNLNLSYPNDTYVVNEQSHTIYYVKGITIDNETYYKLPINYDEIFLNLRFKIEYRKGNYGTFENKEFQNLKYGDKIPEFTGEITGEDGYVFFGWQIESTGEIVSKVEGTVTRNETYIAQWGSNVQEIEFELFGGENNPANSEITSYELGTKTVIYNPERIQYGRDFENEEDTSGIDYTLNEENLEKADEYIFGGWYLDKEYTIELSKDERGNYCIPEECGIYPYNVIYAKWIAPAARTYTPNVKDEYIFEYIGDVQEFIVPTDGYYKFELYGAQGGSADDTHQGGYGGYSTGVKLLHKGDVLYVAVGGAGTTARNSVAEGGYNGGGNAKTCSSNDRAGSGGGATHIATRTGELETLSDYREDILIVAGGGGGNYLYNSGNRTISSAGNGGGEEGGLAQDINSSWSGRRIYQGVSANIERVGTSNSFSGDSSLAYKEASFGKGGDGAPCDWASGGGAGYYGGGFGWAYSANGGCGYIEGVGSYGRTKRATSISSHTGNGFAKIIFLEDTNKMPKYYETLEEAILDCEENADISTNLLMLKDVKETNKITNGKNIILNLNGKTITYGEDTTDTELTTIDIKSGKLQVIGKGKIENKHDYGRAIKVEEEGTFIYGDDDGEVLIDEPILEGGLYGIDNNGTFNYYDGKIIGKIAINGEVHDVPYLKNPVIRTEENKQIAILATLTDVEATIGKKTFTKLELAIDYANNKIADDGSQVEIVIVKDLTKENEILIDETKNIKLNLNGYKTVITASFKNQGKLEIVDTSEEQTGAITSDTVIAIINEKELKVCSGTIKGITAIRNNDPGTITVTGGTIKSTYLSNTYGFAIENNSTELITIENGTISGWGGIIWSGRYGTTVISASIKNNKSGTVIVNGGTIITNGSDSRGVAIRNEEDGTIVINGGNVTSSPYEEVIINQRNGTIKINGGKITSTSNGGDIISNKGSGEIIITNGIIDGSVGIENNVNGAIKISGGTIKGSVDNNNTGNVTITGGEIIANSRVIYNNAGEIRIAGCKISQTYRDKANWYVYGEYESSSNSYAGVYNEQNGNIIIEDGAIIDAVVLGVYNKGNVIMKRW